MLTPNMIQKAASHRVIEIIINLSWQDKIDLMKSGVFRSKVIDNPNLTLEDVDNILREYRARKETIQEETFRKNNTSSIIGTSTTSMTDVDLKGEEDFDELIEEDF